MAVVSARVAVSRVADGHRRRADAQVAEPHEPLLGPGRNLARRDRDHNEHDRQGQPWRSLREHEAKNEPDQRELGHQPNHGDGQCPVEVEAQCDRQRAVDQDQRRRREQIGDG